MVSPSLRLRFRTFLIKGMLVASALVFIGSLALFLWTLAPIPEALLARGGDNADGVVLLDRSGIPLRGTRAQNGSDSRWVPYREIDTDIINAFVAVEDQRFWEHSGIDPRAVVRAATGNIMSGRVQSGASTISMQLARVLHHGGKPVARSWSRKFQEAAWALRLERHMSKQEILEQYLNRIFLGQSTAGVAAASALYFGTSQAELSAAQAATLAGIAHAPSRDNPHVSIGRARARRDYALERMLSMGFVLREDFERARDEPLTRSARNAPFLAPHFTTRVLSWLESAAESQTSDVGRTVVDARRSPPDGRVTTSIDAALQRALEKEVSHTVDMLRDRNVMHAAIVVLDNTSGEVLAWVGSPDFWSSEDGQTDMVVSARQPGSALKPFLYGMALDRGYTAASILPDIPTSFPTPTGPYAPRNYDRRFRGPVRAREALASSYNVPAVILAQRLGTSTFLQTLHLAGFKSLDRSAEHYGLGISLGNGDVTLIELANAYRALANGGEFREWTWRAATGNVSGGSRVMSPGASAILLDMMSDPIARIPGFGVSTPFDFPFPVAVKTGTSRHFSDNWAIGTTRGFTVAVWAGNFSGKPMEGVSGVSGAGPLLHRAIMHVAQKVDPGALTKPSEVGAIPVEICALSGMLANNSCARMTEWFMPGSEPRSIDTWERNGSVTLPDEFAEWSATAMTGARVATFHGAVGDTDDSSGDAAGRNNAGEGSGTTNSDSAAVKESSTFRIISPLEGDKYFIPSGVELRYATIPLLAGGAGADSVKWTINGTAYQGARWELSEGKHVLTARSVRGDSATVTIVVSR